MKKEVMPSVIVVVAHTLSILHQDGPGNKRYTKNVVAITITADEIEGRNDFFKYKFLSNSGIFFFTE